MGCNIIEGILFFNSHKGEYIDSTVRSMTKIQHCLVALMLKKQD
jgi:hypothetical protein